MHGKRMHFAILSFHGRVCEVFFLWALWMCFFFKSNVNQIMITGWWNANFSFTSSYHPNSLIYMYLSVSVFVWKNLRWTLFSECAWLLWLSIYMLLTVMAELLVLMNLCMWWYSGVEWSGVVWFIYFSFILKIMVLLLSLFCPYFYLKLAFQFHLCMYIT